MVFPVVMYGCESWTIKKAEHRKNWCFWTVVLEKTLESPLDCKEIQPVHPKGDQSWVFIGRTEVEAETPILWAPGAKRWLIGKDPYAGKDWRWEKGVTEDEMVGWYHRFNEYDLSQLWELVMDREAWRAAAWGRKESDTTERLNWTEWVSHQDDWQYSASIKTDQCGGSRDRWERWDLRSGIWMDIDEPLGLELPSTPVRTP